jgi:PAS domain S-box-containing protein
MSGYDGSPIPLRKPETEPKPDFKALFESGPGLHLLLAPDMRIIAASDSFLRATRKARDQIIGKTLPQAFPNDLGELAVGVAWSLRASAQRVLRTRTPDTMATQKYSIVPIESEGGNSEERYWSGVNYPVFDETGQITFIIHRMEDVTELVRLQQHQAEGEKTSEQLRTKATRLEKKLFVRACDLEAANENLRAANEELARLYHKAKEIYQLKTELFASVSHELRTPLSLLLGPLDELLQSPGASIAASRSDLELMHRNSLRLLKLVNTLLDLARIEAGKLRGDYVPTDLTALTAEIAGLFRSLVQKAGIRYELQLEELGQPVYVDRVMWEKVVLNLISNAFKFTMQGSITVALKNAGTCAQLIVTDTGIGIPESDLPHIFERFFRGEATGSRSYEGSGIGLALVHELVKVHGGAVAVQTSMTQGTSFTVSIPFGSAHLPSAPSGAEQARITPSSRAAFEAEAEIWSADVATLEAASEEIPGPSSPSTEPETRPRIVFADDDADMRGYIVKLLSPFYEVEACSNGQQALDAVLKHPPDLVLSDFVMPVMDGAHLVRALKSNPHTAAIPVILLSVRSEADSQIEGLEAGADDYISKPFTTRELLARIKSRLALVQMREEARLALNRSQQGFQELLDTASEAILVADREGRILVFNQTAEKMFGYGPGELLGINVEQLVPETFRAQHARHRAAYMKEPRIRPMGIGLSLQGQRKDGSLFPIEVGLSPNRSSGDMRVIMLVHDISERHKVEEKLRRSQELVRQAEKLEALGRLAGGTAHEFNNLLTMVMGYAALMLSALDSKNLMIDYVEKISEATQRAGALTHQLLAFSRQQALAPQLIDLNVLLTELQGVLPALIGGSIEASFVPAPEAACVRADRSQLHQLMVNLLSNARDAMPGGGRLAIRIANIDLQQSAILEEGLGLAPGPYVELTVSDTGIGMTYDIQSRIFEPFFSTKEFGKGAGLGLAAIYGIVQQSGGTISVKSRPGEGSTFRILLPRVSQEEAPAVHAHGSPDALCGIETVLLVEDNPSLRTLTCEFLQKLGYTILEAADGEEAITRVQQYNRPIDLLLTDVVMPGMNGREMATRIRDRRPGLKVLYVSGYTHDAFTKEGITGSGEALLEKPFAFEELAQKIREVLDAPGLTGTSNSHRTQ